MFSSDAAHYLSVVSKVQQVQQRLTDIMAHLFTHHPRQLDQRRPSPPRMRSFDHLGGAILASQHRVAVIGNTWMCALCLTSPSADMHLSWLYSTCESNFAGVDVLSQSLACHAPVPHIPISLGGKFLDHSHSLVVFKGLFYCLRCGCLAATRSMHLSAPCVGSPSSYGIANLSRLRKGMLPYNLYIWPLHRPRNLLHAS